MTQTLQVNCLMHQVAKVKLLKCVLQKQGGDCPEIWVKDHFEREDRSSFPPYVSFRFEVEDERIISTLRRAISSYKVLIDWVLMGYECHALPGMNWVIEPARMKEVETKAGSLGLSSEDYLSEYEPEFGPIAFEDLAGLTQYVRQVFLG
ncbi:hypothetical protein KTQ74_00160 [Pseudomonas chlororaphis]|uniref:hypothetical protein n=1 Tax=Pseudomonas chlororaphis TaxID=587753 RepID=UPI001E50BC80|nr:hypothetical protein [Pseudomonas chlororaphis]MCB2250285.1 hypothetical protein [Pseudomonas chlororaphis]